MADEQENIDAGVDDDVAVQSPSGGKKGFINPFIIKVLTGVLVFIVLVVMMFIVSIIVMQTGRQSTGGASRPVVEDVREQKKEHLEYFELEDPFRQQLRDGTMIQLQLAIGFTAGDKKIQAELTQNQPEVRDIIIKSLSRLKSDYFQNENPLDKLEEDLIKQINKILNSGRVQRIFFLEYTLMGVN